MRFAKLSLEKYGHFDGRTLEFPSGPTDLHLIYGANEAGKSTSLAAVSDLLFGIPMRSPYNFRFDYPLLRIGAVVEEDGQLLPVRRRKAGNGTLIDAEDRPMDEAPLLGMLRGQTRETFGRSFSLDQTALREGGDAMVRAKDDAGQALFAAGSNLTGVASVLASLEDESERIWGKRAKASRTFTIAERNFDASLKTVRESSLKPKAWSDTRAAADDARSALKELEERRSALKQELRSLDRLRGVAGLIETRAGITAELAALSEVAAIGEQVETQSRECLDALERAERDRATAQRLMTEAEERLSSVSVDSAVLGSADTIERLLEKRGAELKADDDLPRLQARRQQLEETVRRLEREFGSAVAVIPARTVVAELREILSTILLARKEAADAAEKRADAEGRRSNVADRLVAAPVDKTLPSLISAVEAARQLGADFDQRCEAAAERLMRALEKHDGLVGQLKPWSGTDQALGAIPVVPDQEVQVARERHAQLESEARDASASTIRLKDEAERIALQIENASLAEAAVTAETLAAARSGRDAEWALIRDGVVSGRALDGAEKKTADFEGLVEKSDSLADRRYASAEASGRLAEMADLRGQRILEAEQADRAAARAEEDLASMRRQWEERLTSAGLPLLAPMALIAWQLTRADALKAATEVSDLKGELARAEARRKSAIAALCKELSMEVPADGALAPLLISAEAILVAREEEAASRRDLVQDQTRLSDEVDALKRAGAAKKADEQTFLVAWDEALGRAGIQLAVAQAGPRFDIIDELRAASEELVTLATRVTGIERDAGSFRDEVTALAQALECDLEAAPSAQLEDLKQRLASARAASAQAGEHRAEISRRRGEEAEASAKAGTARASLADAMALLGVEQVDGLPERLDASAQVRRLRDELRNVEADIVGKGDGYSLIQLAEELSRTTPEEIASRAETITFEIDELDTLVSEAASAYGEARRRFEELNVDHHSAADAQADAEAARAEMAAQAEAYLMKRTQAVMLRWAIEKYRKRHQDPMLAARAKSSGRSRSDVIQASTRICRTQPQG
jgi:uncharacterized protein YhaN